MVKVTFVSAVLITALVLTSQAMAARSDRAGHRATKAHAVAKDCVRAPNVGAFASDPWTIPPCMPNSATDTFN
jgi:hypothetical protein